MNDKTRVPQVRARVLAEPSNDRHPTVIPLVIDQYFPAQVVIEMDLVPRLLQQVDALLDGLHANRTRVPGREHCRAIGSVVQEQDKGGMG